jgi:diguanylate cyclase
MNPRLLALADALLTTDRRQRIRLTRCGMACLLMVYSSSGMAYLVWAGMAPLMPVLVWALVAIGGMFGFYAAIRTGFNLRFADPSLTLAQMAFALAGRGRGAVFPILIVVLMFGLYSLRPHQMRRIATTALAMFGGAMVLMALVDPLDYPPEVEFGHFLVIAIMLPAVTALANQLSRLRDRLRLQKAELEDALVRIQELALRDELTGLANRRHMQSLIELEHQRSVRSGHSFCLAVLDIDRFKRINDTHGHPAGDRVLRAFAREALSTIRSADVLARWGGEEFLLMMPDTRATLARLGVERLRTRMETLRVDIGGEPLAFTLSVGVVEHRAGETIPDAIARADRALYQAKQQGRNKVVAG